MIKSYNYFSIIFKKIYQTINSDSFLKQLADIREEGHYVLTNIFKDYDQDNQKAILLNRYFDNNNHICYFGYSKSKNKIIAGGEDKTIDFLPICPMFDDVNNSSIIRFFESDNEDDPVFKKVSNIIRKIILDGLLTIQQSIIDDENNDIYQDKEFLLIKRLGSFAANAYDYASICKRNEILSNSYVFLLRDDHKILTHLLNELVHSNVITARDTMTAISYLIKYMLNYRTDLSLDINHIFSKKILNDVFNFYDTNSAMVTDEDFINISQITRFTYTNNHVTSTITSDDFYNFIKNKNIYNIYTKLITKDYSTFFEKENDGKEEYESTLSKNFLSIVQSSVSYFEKEKKLSLIDFKVSINEDFLDLLLDDNIPYREKINKLSNIENIIKSDSFYISPDVSIENKKHLYFYIKAVFLQDLYFKKYNKMFKKINDELQ